MTKVAFVGLGRMGGPMALNMARKGFDLAVYDVNPAAMAGFTEFNHCRQATDANDAVGDAEIAITVLPGPPQLEGVVIAEGGMIDAMPDGALLMDLSTVLPETTDRMAARAKVTGRRFVDAPIGRLYTIRNDLSTMRMITSVEGPGESILPPPDSYKGATT